MYLKLGIYIEHEIDGKCAKAIKKMIDGFENVTYCQRLKDLDLFSVEKRLQMKYFHQMLGNVSKKVWDMSR